MIYSIPERALYVARRRLPTLPVGQSVLFELPAFDGFVRADLILDLMKMANFHWGSMACVATFTGGVVLELKRAHARNPRKH